MLKISGLVSLLFGAYQLILLARVLLSWMSLSTQNRLFSYGKQGRPTHFIALSSLVYALTEPLLRPIRKVLFRYQGGMAVDFSPMVLWLLLFLVEGVLLRLLDPTR